MFRTIRHNGEELPTVLGLECLKSKFLPNIPKEHDELGFVFTSDHHSGEYSVGQNVFAWIYYVSEDGKSYTYPRDENGDRYSLDCIATIAAVKDDGSAWARFTAYPSVTGTAMMLANSWETTGEQVVNLSAWDKYWARRSRRMMATVLCKDEEGNRVEWEAVIVAPDAMDDRSWVCRYLDDEFVPPYFAPPPKPFTGEVSMEVFMDAVHNPDFLIAPST